MNNKDFGKLLEERTKTFAFKVIQFSSSIQVNTESRVLKNQLTKSGTSIGANYREANRPRSRADFKNKISICESEASETVYWLELIEKLNYIDKRELLDLLEESKELLAIFTSINKNTKI